MVVDILLLVMDNTLVMNKHNAPLQNSYIPPLVLLISMALCMKDRKYDKRHFWSKNHSGCLETLCHVRGPLRNKTATLGVCSDIDPSADPVPDQTMLPTVSLTESDIPRAFLKPSI